MCIHDLMIESQDASLEQRVEPSSTSTLNERLIFYYAKSTGWILGISALSYNQDCGEKTVRLTESDPNFAYHLAYGSGLYFGFSRTSKGAIASLAVLSLSLSSEVLRLSEGEDLRTVGVSVAQKCIGYGIGVVAGTLLRASGEAMDRAFST